MPFAKAFAPPQTALPSITYPPPFFALEAGSVEEVVAGVVVDVVAGVVVGGVAAVCVGGVDAVVVGATAGVLPLGPALEGVAAVSVAEVVAGGGLCALSSYAGGRCGSASSGEIFVCVLVVVLVLGPGPTPGEDSPPP